MEEELDIILTAVDDASETFQNVSEAANNMGESVQGGAEQGTTGLDGMEEAAEGAADPLEQITSMMEGVVGAEVFNQLADALWDLADKAGTYSDSMMRARLEAEGAGISANEMTDAVSELSATTGRAGSEIRESFIKATARGITDMDSFKAMMEGAGAQATLFGTDIQSMSDKFSNMAMRSTLMERSLASTGITMEELADAMNMSGATADEVKSKWQELDTNQRAAILGQAASMNEGKTANEEYKKSWAGLQAQIDIAKGRIERLAGEVLLPVLVPALEVAARVLNFLGDAVSALVHGPFGGLISIIGAAAAAFALAVPGYMAVQAAITLLTATAIPAATALWSMVAPLLPFIALGAAVAYVVFEIGKAFGWWTDVSSMLDAIWAGINRLWSAFINHPDVQGFIQAMSVAWAALRPYIVDVVKWVLSFFTESSNEKFDAVRAIIDTVGNAWNNMTFPIRLVISVIKKLIVIFVTMKTRAEFEIRRVKLLFSELPGHIGSAISKLANIITAPFRDAYTNISKTVENIKTKAESITNISISGITSKLTQPIQSAWETISGVVEKIKSKIGSISNISIPHFFGGEDLPLSSGAYGGEDLTPTTNITSTDNLHVTNDVNLSLDLRNVPPGMDEELLREALISSLTSREVLSVLVNNNDFQALDSKAKTRLNLKRARVNGV